MGVFLGQLPPAEIARLKAELAETLIAHFCYPRFFDYRIESLRTRPVDRSKRQEVWLYLSSVDFTAWNRVDLMSPDFQYHIERLIIHFVQRNRSFFGEQGRKRMADIRCRRAIDLYLFDLWVYMWSDTENDGGYFALDGYREVFGKYHHKAIPADDGAIKETLMREVAEMSVSAKKYRYFIGGVPCETIPENYITAGTSRAV